MNSTLKLNSNLTIRLCYRNFHLCLYISRYPLGHAVATSVLNLSKFNNIVRLMSKSGGFLMSTEVDEAQSSIDAVEELIELEYYIIGAYKVALENLENIEYKDKFREFKTEHKIYIEELSTSLAKSKLKAQMSSNTIKHLLTEGKIKFTSIFGNEKILSAILRDEEIIITVCKRANFMAGNDNNMSKIMTKVHSGIKQHQDWIRVELKKYDDNVRCL